MKSIGIIGTAGRKGCMNGHGFPTFKKMLEKTLEQVNRITDEGPALLISGGAAWADHLAVILYVLNPERFQLHLHLPAPLTSAVCFEETAARYDDGRTANYYHTLFSRSVFPDAVSTIRGIPTIQNLIDALELGAKYWTYKGFKARNMAVAQESKDAIIAITWDQPGSVVSGRTGHIWAIAQAQEKIHISLPVLLGYGAMPKPEHAV